MFRNKINLRTICIILLVAISAASLSACKEKSDGRHEFFLNSPSITLTVGQSEELTYTSETDGTSDNGEVTFISSAPSVVSVTAEGVLTGVSEGLATVTATHVATGDSAECSVTVLRAPVTETTLTLSRTAVELYMGDSEQGETPESLTLVPTVMRDGKDVTSNYTFDWTTSDETVAVVDEQGTVTAVNPGTAYVTASIDADGYPVTAVCAVTVDGVLESLPDDPQIYMFDLSSYTQPSISFDYEVTAVRMSDTMENIPFSTSDGAVTPDFSGITKRGRIGLVIESEGYRMKTTAYVADRVLYSASELVALTQTDTAGKWFVLGQDIDFTEYLVKNPWTTANNLIPGTFSGVLDGDGHKVTGIVRSATAEELAAAADGFSQWEAGIFHTIAEGSVVCNLYIEMEQEYYRGSLFAAYVRGELRDCYIKSSVTATDTAYYGQRLAVIHQATGTITRCVFESVTGNDNISIVYIPNPLGVCATFENNIYIIPNNTKGGGDQIFNRSRSRIAIGNVYSYKSVSNLLTGTPGLVYDDTTDEDGKMIYASAEYTGNVFGQEGWENWSTDDTSVYLCGREIRVVDIVDISTPEELINITQGAEGTYYRLTQDIDFTEYLAENPWTTENNLIPGTFSGVLDGNGHKITGIMRSATAEELTASGSGYSQWEAGIFHTIAEGSVVRNLYIEMEQAYGRGSLFAAYVHGTFRDCYIKSSVTVADSQYWGQRLAVIHQATGTITRCVFESDTANDNLSIVYIPNPAGASVTFEENMYIIANNTKGGGDQIFNRSRSRIEIGSVYAYKSVSDLLTGAAGLVYDDTTDGEGKMIYESAEYTGNVFEAGGWEQWKIENGTLSLCGRVIVSSAS